MPWHIEADNAACDGYAVVKDDDGEVEGCHRTRGQAERQMAALYASEPEARAPGDPGKAWVEDQIRDMEDRGEDVTPIDDDEPAPRTRRQEVEEILAELRAARYSPT